MVERTAMAESSESLNIQPSPFNRLCDIVAKLRAPGGCPWDREQTHESLLPATIEEAYEVAEAARAKNDAHFREELGETKSAIATLAAASPSRGGQDRQSLEDEIGDLLFAVVNLARKCKLEAESALQKATNKFVARFNRLEDDLRARGKRLGDVDLAELDEIWNQIKQTSNIERPMPNT